MGKRQVRVLRKDIPMHLQELQEQSSVHVVARSNAVFQGKITNVTSEKIELEDRRKMRHVVAIDQINEIIYDKETAF